MDPSLGLRVPTAVPEAIGGRKTRWRKGKQEGGLFSFLGDAGEGGLGRKDGWMHELVEVWRKERRKRTLESGERKKNYMPSGAAMRGERTAEVEEVANRLWRLQTLAYSSIRGMNGG